MIDIADGYFGLYPFYPHGLEQEERGRTGGVLRECLVYGDSDFLTLRDSTGY